MSIISMRLPEKLIDEVDANAKMLHLSRTEYIRYAVEHMNNEALRRLRHKKLANASLRTRKDSMNINKLFSRIEHDIDDEAR